MSASGGPRHSAERLARRALREQPLEAPDVDLLATDAQLVAAPVRDDRVALTHRVDRLAQMRHVQLDQLARRRGRRFAPQSVDQLVGRHRRAGVQREQREQRALLRATERDRVAVRRHLDRSEQQDVHVVVRRGDVDPNRAPEARQRVRDVRVPDTEEPALDAQRPPVVRRRLLGIPGSLRDLAERPEQQRDLMVVAPEPRLDQHERLAQRHHRLAMAPLGVEDRRERAAVGGDPERIRSGGGIHGVWHGVRIPRPGRPDACRQLAQSGSAASVRSGPAAGASKNVA